MTGVVAILLVSAGVSYAQQSGYVLANSYYLSETKKISASDRKETIDLSLFPRNIDLNAVRNFISRFPDAENILWYKGEKYTSVSFTQNGIKTRTSYTNTGKWLFDMRSYPQQNLLKDIRSQVKSVYYDFDICLVDEITNPWQKYYVIHLHGDGVWKNIRICDGEMEVIQDLVELK